MSKKSLELGNLCRTCMANCSKVSPGTSFKKIRRCIYQKPIGWDDGPKIMDLLRSVLPQIPVHVKDKLPKIMCTICIEKLLMTFEFLETCKDTDKNFRKIFKETSTSNDEGHVDPKGLVDPVLGSVEEKLECKEPNEDTSEPQPDFDAMFTNSWSNEEVCGLDFADNSFGFESDDRYSISMETSNKNPSKKRSKSRTNKNSTCNATKIDEQLDPFPNEDGSITCQECGLVSRNVILWQEHILEHNSSEGPSKKYSKHDEQQTLNESLGKSDRSTKKIKKVTEELMALRTQVKQLKALCSETETNLLLNLPFYALSDLQEFDSKILSDKEMRLQLKNMIHRVDGTKVASFLRKSIKSVISDELAVNLTWRGVPGKPSFQRFALYDIVKDICVSKFENAKDSEINKILQQHFVHANDRLRSTHKKKDG